MYAHHTRGESIISMATDSTNSFLFTADTKGLLKSWDITRVDVEHMMPNSAVIPVHSFFASCGSVVSIDIIEQELGKPSLLLTASVDETVRLWTFDGRYLGIFGADRWDLNNRFHYRSQKPPDIEKYEREIRESQEDDLDKQDLTTEEEETREENKKVEEKKEKKRLANEFIYQHGEALTKPEEKLKEQKMVYAGVNVHNPTTSNHKYQFRTSAQTLKIHQTQEFILPKMTKSLRYDAEQMGLRHDFIRPVFDSPSSSSTSSSSSSSSMSSSLTRNGLSRSSSTKKKSSSSESVTSFERSLYGAREGQSYIKQLAANADSGSSSGSSRGIAGSSSTRSGGLSSNSLSTDISKIFNPQGNKIKLRSISPEQDPFKVQFDEDVERILYQVEHEQKTTLPPIYDPND
eukprot:TRINITY_DN2741_c0_g2_i2.p1 TRINITY_DN2741_c0_g2~~TRINITY_DN2741_c0_g2_i2.p1  ORF type:complete len:404 (+),score=125.32 TRINITY_DN2741_c0_g2_i2:157-1368(+)